MLWTLHARHWFVISQVFWHWHEGSFSRNAPYIYPWYEIENYCQFSNISRTKSRNLNVFISSCNFLCVFYWSQVLSREQSGDGWICEVSCGGHHRQRGKTTTGSVLGAAVLDFTQILAYLVHNMSRSQLYLITHSFTREWNCSWSSAGRRCSNYIWVINNFSAY